jgi:3-hydroxyisobutyrate dehydrogenase-like beta-hydroxyacid dehydrogenase
MAAEAARRELHFVDAPVTGSAPAAAEAKLIFWVGADRPTWEEFGPYCCVWATKLFIRAGMAPGPPWKW